MTIIANGDLTRKVMPGNYVQVTGVFLPATKTTFKQMTQGLMFDTYLEAHVLFNIILYIFLEYNCC